jgi:hypothetical protein
MTAQDNLSRPQFFHGTDAKFAPGDLLTPRGANQYGRQETESGRGYVFMTGDQDQARNYAAARAGGGNWQIQGGHVYQVEPTGKYQEDPNDLYDSVRTRAKVRVVKEMTY